MSGEGDADRVMRLFRFRPADSGFDTTFREVMLPDLVGLPGLEAVFAGRQGPSDVGERVVATIWASHDAMASGVGTSFDRPIFHPEYLPDTVDKRLDVGRIAYTFETGEIGNPQVIRLLFGRTLPGRLAEYVARAREGTEIDHAAGRAPLALHLVELDEDRFVTLSLWGQWSKLGEATGGTIEVPVATRHRELLAEWHAEHYEAMPDVPAIARTGSN